MTIRQLEEPGRALRWTALALGVAHLAICLATGHLRPEHVVVDGLLAGLPFLGRRAASFAVGALPMWLGVALYDGQKLFVGLRGPVHTGDLWALERRTFPAPGGLTWSEWLGQHAMPVLDLAAGFAYATYALELVAVAVVLSFVRPESFRALSLSFLFANLLGLSLYLLYPAAPPWYVLAHGPGPADLSAVGDPAGAARFDQLLGIDFFARFYSRNPNVFGAMPSLHAAYPTLVAWYLWRFGWKARIATVAYGALVWFAAIYLGHHWLLDVLAGALAALAAAGLQSALGLVLAARRAPAPAPALRPASARAGAEGGS